MKQITLKLYSFNELNKEAKEMALTTYRNMNVNFNWWDDEYEDFIELCSSMGIAVIKDKIKFEGFYSQGDGSAFSAAVDVVKLITAIEKQSWKDYAQLQEFPLTAPDIDKRVLRLLANDILPKEPQVIARYKPYSVVVDLGVYVINEKREHDNVFEELDKLEVWLQNIALILNRYRYSTLEKQYEFLISETAIKESILNNEYLFTADGRSANYLTALTKKKHKNQ